MDAKSGTEQDKPRNYTGEAAEYGRGEAIPLKVPFVHLHEIGQWFGNEFRTRFVMSHVAYLTRLEQRLPN
jgi:hypothetical protein